MTHEENRQLREIAGRFMLEGNYQKATEAYRRLLEIEPLNAKVRLRFAETLQLLGQQGAAIAEYERLVAHFMEEGFVAQAIAVVRILLRLDPTREDMKVYLQEWSLGHLGEHAKERHLAAKEHQPGQLALDDLLPVWQLTKTELRDVIRHMEFASFQPGESLCDLCKEKGHKESLFGLVTGGARAVTVDGHGHPVHFEVLKAGTFFCEHLFMRQSECRVRVIAEKPTKVMFVGRERIANLLKSFPQIRQWVEEHHRQRALSRIISLQSVFRHFPHQAREELVRRFSQQRYSSGQMIVRQGGEREGAFYVLRDGVVRVFVTPRGSSRSVHLSELREGDCFGGVGFLSNRPHRTTVRAQTDVDVWVLSASDLHAVAQSYPVVREVISNFMKLELLVEASVGDVWGDAAGIAVGE